MSRPHTLALPALFALALAAVPVFTARAQRATAGSTSGVFFGLQYTGTSVSVKSAAENLEFGSGFGLHVGVGLTENVSVLANFDRGVLTRRFDDSDVTISQYDALLRAYLVPGPTSPVRVFATGGVTGRAATGSTDFKGVAPTAGAGVHLGLSPNIALTGSALWTFGNLTRLSTITGGNTTRQDFKSTGTRIQVGASLYLFK